MRNHIAYFVLSLFAILTLSSASDLAPLVLSVKGDLSYTLPESEGSQDRALGVPSMAVSSESPHYNFQTPADLPQGSIQSACGVGYLSGPVVSSSEKIGMDASDYTPPVADAIVQKLTAESGKDGPKFYFNPFTFNLSQSHSVRIASTDVSNF